MISGLESSALEQEPAAKGSCRLRFTDVAETSGIRFVFANGYTTAKLMPHSTSGGAGWIDYDLDGKWDLFFPQGGSLTADSWVDQPKDQLFRSLGSGSFIQVTEFANLTDTQYGHGVAIGDFDNDGFDDIYITNVGPDVLFHNMGDGTFQDVTALAGIDAPQWGSSAAWGDLDRDGDLDLYVCNYMDYDPRRPIACVDENGTPITCNPTQLSGKPNLCYFNNGDGTFTECADARGLNAEGSKSLGVVIADLNGDGEPEVFVANDTAANHLFVNRGGGRFVENALALGCALTGLGQFQAGMGVAFGDYDRDGLPDLYLTTFTDESNTLFRNLGSAGFADVTREVGLHQPTIPQLAFGTVMADFDANGWQDLFVANGHIDDFRKLNGSMWYMAAQLFSFDGRRWRECTSQGGPYFEREWLGRAVASADFDDDGDLDLAVVHQNDPAALLRNDSPQGHWLQLRFCGVESNRRGIGVKVTLKQDRLTLVQQLPGGTSYCASHQPWLHFGLGESSGKLGLTVEWPSGRRQQLSEVAVDQNLSVRESDAEQP